MARIYATKQAGRCDRNIQRSPEASLNIVAFNVGSMWDSCMYSCCYLVKTRTTNGSFILSGHNNTAWIMEIHHLFLSDLCVSLTSLHQRSSSIINAPPPPPPPYLLLWHTVLLRGVDSPTWTAAQTLPPAAIISIKPSAPPSPPAPAPTGITATGSLQYGPPHCTNRTGSCDGSAGR